MSVVGHTANAITSAAVVRPSNFRRIRRAIAANPTIQHVQMRFIGCFGGTHLESDERRRPVFIPSG